MNGQGRVAIFQLTGSSTCFVWNRCPLNLKQPRHHRWAVVRVLAPMSIELSERNRGWDQTTTDRTEGTQMEFHRESPFFHRKPPIYWNEKEKLIKLLFDKLKAKQQRGKYAESSKRAENVIRCPVSTFHSWKVFFFDKPLCPVSLMLRKTSYQFLFLIFLLPSKHDSIIVGKFEKFPDCFLF